MAMMHRPVSLLAFGLIVALLRAEAFAHGDESTEGGWDSVYAAASAEDLFPNEPDEYDELLADSDAMLAPTLDITAEGVVSAIPYKAWNFDAEMVVFHPNYGSVDFTDNGDDQYFATPRLTIGWESQSGFGIRGRLWGYEAEGEVPAIGNFFAGGFASMRGFDFRGASPAGIGTESKFLRTGSLDVDFYKRFELDRSDIVVGSGLKSAGFQLEYPGWADNTVLGSGVSLFTDLRHVLHRSNKGELAFVSSGRVGFLTGEWRNNSFQPNLSTNTTLIPSNEEVGGLLVAVPAVATTTIVEHDADMVISEASLGLEWRRDLGWSVLTLRAQYEAQLWNTDITDDLTFTGGAVKAGLSW